MHVHMTPRSLQKNSSVLSFVFVTWTSYEGNKVLFEFFKESCMFTLNVLVRLAQSVQSLKEFRIICFTHKEQEENTSVAKNYYM